MTAPVQSQFLRLLSHELRTPLTGIRGYSELLREEQLSDRQRHMLTMLGSCVHRLDSLIDDLLLLSSVDAGGYGLVVEDLDLNRLCERVVRAHTAHARPGAPAVRLRCARDTGVVQADPRQLEHLLVALLNHAAGCFAGSTDLLVTTAADGADVRIGVTVAAAGPPADIVGLGLAVVRAIAGEHGGSVTADPTELLVVLPRTVRPGERVVHRPVRRRG